MLKPNKRLRGSQSVEEILEKGEFKKSKFFAVRQSPNQESCNRYTVVVSSKLSKSAVQRNRIRRQIYAALEELEKKGTVPKESFFDIVVLVRSAGMKLSYEEIVTGLRELTPHP